MEMSKVNMRKETTSVKIKDAKEEAEEYAEHTTNVTIIEIIPKSGFYDFTNKYPFLNPQAGGGAEHVCPAKIEETLTRQIQELALRAYRSIGLRVYSRVDVLLPENAAPTVLEVTTI